MRLLRYALGVEGENLYGGSVTALMCSLAKFLGYFIVRLAHASLRHRLEAHAAPRSCPRMRCISGARLPNACFMLMQSSCPTPVGTPLRAMLQGGQLQVCVPSTEISPQTVFGSLDPKSLAALQAAFHDSFAGEAQESKVRCASCLSCLCTKEC